MNLIQHTLLLGVRVYRCTLSPLKAALFGPFARCRFTPSCSGYALEAIARHGAARGVTLAARRLCRCHPWGDCGHDPVPEPRLKCDGVSVVADPSPPHGPAPEFVMDRSRVPALR